MTNALRAMRVQIYAMVFAAISMSLPTSAKAQNLLVNPSFEAPPVRADGDLYVNQNTGNMQGWFIDGGGSVNVPQVDGAGGANYISGPQSDASNVPAGQPQRFLDFGAGNRSVYQSFTPKCTASYRFGASFAGRQNQAGWGRTTIVSGNTPSGPVVASSPTLSIVASSPAVASWQPSAGTTTLNAGQVYTFKIEMDDLYTASDEAFVERSSECVPVPEPMKGDHYQCYRVTRAMDLKTETLEVRDQFGQAKVVLGRPVQICNPAVKVHNGVTYGVESPERHLVCYSIVKPSAEQRTRRVKINNQMAPDTLDVGQHSVFCVPSSKMLIGEREAPVR